MQQYKHVQTATDDIPSHTPLQSLILESSQHMLLSDAVHISCIEQHLPCPPWHPHHLPVRSICCLQCINGLLVSGVAKLRHHHSTIGTVVVDVAAREAGHWEARDIALGDVLRLSHKVQQQQQMGSVSGRSLPVLCYISYNEMTKVAYMPRTSSCRKTSNMKN